MKRILINFILILVILSCQARKDKRINTIKEFLKSDKGFIKPEKNGMANPIMLSAAGGFDIGRLLNAYYRTGQQDNAVMTTAQNHSISFQK